jgi:anti-sigma factor RsiW
MDCKGFRKYIGAFADGELEVEQNLDALEHLNMCPVCAARVNAVSSLKAALKRIYGGIHAPHHLRERVLHALEVEAGQTDPSVTALGVPGVRRWRGRLAVPLGMAAALAAALAVWQLWPARDLRTDVRLVVPGRVAAEVREQHRFCIGHRGRDHFDPSLSRDLPVIAERLSARLGIKVMAPDLSGLGFELAGADACGINGRAGAHLMYRLVTTGQLLSVFTVDRWAELGGEEGRATGDEGYFVSSDSDQLCVVAWHDGPQTYMLCSDMPEHVLLQIGGHLSGATASRPIVHSAASPCLAVTIGSGG